MKIEKVCLECNKIFFVVAALEKTAKFCSQECYQKHPKKKLKIEKQCLDCGKLFFVILSRAHIAKYCSKICADKHTLRGVRKSKKVDKTCLGCGSIFYVIPSQKNKAKYCSKQCVYKYAFADKKYEKTGANITCSYCGNKFYVVKCNVNKTKYCSIKCKSAARKGISPANKKEKINKICLTCGKKFMVTLCREIAQFCSRKCHYEYPERKKTQKKGIIKNCVTCNKELYVTQGRKNTNKYCSKECYAKYRKSEDGIAESKKINVGLKYEPEMRALFIKHKTNSQYYCLSCGNISGDKYFCSLACFYRGYKYLPACILRHLITVYEIQIPLGVMKGNGGLSIEARKRISNKHKGNSYSLGHIISDEQKAIWSIKNKERWKDPEFARKVLTTMGQSKEEIVLDKILQENFPNIFKYVGNKAFQVGAKYPDFVSTNDNKLIIELWGEHWHFGQNPQDRIDYFNKYDYRSLVIWAKELRKKDLLLQKINKFLQEV